MNDKPTPKVTFRRHRGPVTNEDLEAAYSQGMLKKEDLKDGEWYLGDSRAGRYGMWHGTDNCFYVTKSSMGMKFGEALNHPADDNGYALFSPIEHCPELDEEFKSKPSRRSQG